MSKLKSLLAASAVGCIGLVCLLTACQNGYQAVVPLKPPTTEDRQFVRSLSTRPNDVLVLDGRRLVPPGVVTVTLVGTKCPPVVVYHGPTDRQVVINFQDYPDKRPLKSQIKVTVANTATGAPTGTDTYLFNPTSPP